MGALRRALKEIFNENCFLSGTTLAESRRRFSVRCASGEQVVGIRVDDCIVSGSSKRCDGIFFAWRPGSARFAIVLVELKGSDLKEAIAQVKATARFLRDTTNCPRSDHQHFMHETFPSTFGPRASHGSGLLAVAVSRRGIPRSFKEKKELWDKHRIRFKHLQPSDSISLTVDRLMKFAQERAF